MEYPPKPVLTVSENNWSKTAVSLLAFLVVYYVLFDQDLFQVFSIIAILIIHEAGHFLAMKYFGYTDVRMMFVPLMGAYVSGSKEKIEQKENVLVILAGPIPGIIVGLLLGFIFKGRGVDEIDTLARMFIFINAFNLLPVVPLDGGRLIEALWLGRKDTILSIFLVISFLIIGIVALYFGIYLLIILQLFLLMRLWALWVNFKIRLQLKEEGIDYDKSFSELTDKEYWAIRKIVIKVVPHLGSADTKKETIVSYVQGVLQNFHIAGLSILFKILIIIIWLLSLFVAPFLILFLTR